MIEQIEHIEIPDWLKTNDFKFNIKNVLEDSLYYPCAHFDGDPVKFLMGNVYTFIYVDYGVSKDQFLTETDQKGFKGYHIIYKQSINQEELTPSGWNVHINPNLNERSPNESFYKDFINKPFCEWIIFERDPDRDSSYNAERFSLLYICADGAAAYQALYLSNNIKPKIIAIIQPGTGFGENWTNFKDPNKVFARSVFHSKDLLPDYKINGGCGKKNMYDTSIWDEYNISVAKLSTGRANLSIWKHVN